MTTGSRFVTTSARRSGGLPPRLAMATLAARTGDAINAAAVLAEPVRFVRSAGT